MRLSCCQGIEKTNKQTTTTTTKTIKIRECVQIEKEVGIIRCIHQDSSRKRWSVVIFEAESSEEASYELWIQGLEMTRERSSNSEEIVSVPKLVNKGGIQKESWVKRSQGEELLPST